MDRVPAIQLVIRALAGMMVLANSPLGAQFGNLPPGSVLRQSFEGVRAEIGTMVLVDSSVVARFVPAGLHFMTLGAVAARDTSVARYVALHPELKTAVATSLVFSRLDSLRINDGAPTRQVGAFWWVRARPTPPLASPVPGDVYVELGYWSPDPNFVRLQGDWPPLQVAPVEVEQAADGEWSLRLTLKDASIRARCRPVGARTPSSYSLPSFTTLWAGGVKPTVYDIYTYYGHHSQPCAGEWTAEGNGPLAVALARAPKDVPAWGGPRLEDSWHARSARYRR
jgi:hypothetical protein